MLVNAVAKNDVITDAAAYAKEKRSRRELGRYRKKGFRNIVFDALIKQRMLNHSNNVVTTSTRTTIE